ncbi:MAG: glycosyltransferase family 2 protein, partial [Verrucomicrobia bacterium]|nr:glycosyltransferase family 2 protein [Verrucomicrobiota bacterium]
DLIRYTLESVRRASAGVSREVWVVDDGSVSPVVDDLARLGFTDEVTVIRQQNRGLLFARLAGFAAANGRYTLFLDSDDLVAPGKLRAQIAAMDATGCEVSYTDTARCVLEGDYDQLRIVSDAPARSTADGTDFFINIQPAPHSPMFRTDFLRDVVQRAYFPPSPLFNCVAEIWFYHNAAPRAARAVHVAGPLTISGLHPSARLTNHWERLGIASLAVMEAFARSVPATPETACARRYVGEKAFRSWRRLPRGFSREFEDRILAVWRDLAGGNRDFAALGGAAFRFACRLFGPIAAGHLFRRWQNGPYEPIRTVPPEELQRLLAALPAP